MKHLSSLLLVLTVCLVSGCSTSTELTTTHGETAATVANASDIGAGASIASADTAAGTTISSISGSNLVLSVPATITGTAKATFKNTVAFQFTYDEDGILKYGQTIGVALETILPKLIADANNAATLANDVNTLLEGWGLTSASSSEAKVVSEVTSEIKTVATDGNALETLVTGLTTSGVPTK